MRIDTRAPFKIEPGSPAPLSLRVKRKVRFGECDPAGVVWHGVYPIFFEEAREALNSACGLTYAKFKAAAVFMPIKTIFFDYTKPLVYEHSYAMRSILHWTESIRINMEYRINEIDDANPEVDGDLCTSGFSVQLAADFNGKFQVEYPLFYQEFLHSWAAGNFSALQSFNP